MSLQDWPQHFRAARSCKYREELHRFQTRLYLFFSPFVYFVWGVLDNWETHFILKFTVCTKFGSLQVLLQVIVTATKKYVCEHLNVSRVRNEALSQNGSMCNLFKDHLTLFRQRLQPIEEQQQHVFRCGCKAKHCER